MILRFLTFVFALWAMAGAARADDAAFRACVDKAGADEAALMRCSDERVARANAALDVAWKAALADMPGEAARKALVEEQAAWAAFRDKSCLSHLSSDFPRNVGAVSFAVCRADVIALRTKYLKFLTDN